MTDMESLDRAVEEARADVLALMFDLLRANPARGYTVQQMPALPSFYEEGVDALIAAVSAKARAEERERQKQFHAADGAGMVYASKAAAGMIERIIDEEDAYYHGVPWEEIRRWIKSGEDLWAIYLIGEAHMLATDHQSEVAALSVAGRRGIDQWRTCSSEEAGNGG